MIRINPGLRIFALVAPLCLILGWLIGVGWYPPVIIVLAPFAGLAILARPRAAVWLALLGALVVAGLLQLYVPKWQAVRWLVSLLGVAIGAVVLISSLWAGRVKLSEDSRRFFFWAAALFVIAFLANMLQSGSIAVAAVGLKSYFQLWGLLLAIVFMGYTAAEAGRFLYFLLGLALIQWPFALHQYFVLVPKRTNDLDAAQGVVPVDIVSGTFGGNLHGGGLSMDSAVLASITLALAFALKRSERLSRNQVLLFSAFILLPMLFNEAKAIVVLLPMALFTVYRDKLLKNPLQFIGGSIVAIALVGGLLAGYSMLPGAGGGKQAGRLDSFLKDSVLTNFGERGYGRSLLNRTTVYRHWFEENVIKGSFDKVLIGHGPGATNSGSAVSGDVSIAAKRYRGYNIGLTSLSALLWEVGVLGVLAVAGMMWTLYRSASALVDSQLGTAHWPLVLTAKAAIPVFVFSLFLINYFVIDLGMQAMFVTVASYILCMSNLEDSRRGR
ncbi:hypothetical protein [Viridibacterium curvum]|uniref:Uncharacterized protein n=1 Tax=Viridibacterium curvum TaxID=1101404 RepID=A0ABP9QZD9_9RHOO